jgi:transposase
MKRASPKQPQANALKRAEMIMKVRCGLMTAKEAANQLGVSRKTYYIWERRGLTALLEGVGDQKAGRPRKPEREFFLEKRLAQSQAEIEFLEQKIALKEIAAEINMMSGSSRAKKK